jgi:hypothetical protein
MTFDQKVSEIKKLYHQCDKSNKELKKTDVGVLPQWEVDFLLQINAIKFSNYSNGFCSIVADYPMLKVYKGGSEDKVVDFDGNIYSMEDKISELKKNGADGKIKYYARTYPAYQEAIKPEKQINNQYDQS